MNMLYYYERLKLKYKKFEEPGNQPKINNLEKLLIRCKKLYNQIDSFMKIFKLIELKQVSLFPGIYLLAFQSNSFDFFWSLC